MVTAQQLRSRMVQQQLVTRGVRDERVLEAMNTLPRELFVPVDKRAFAYEDAPQSIGSGQTISQPYVVAYMLELLQLKPTDRALEVGAGSGYQAALMGMLAQSVVGIERHEILAAHARESLRAAQMTNVEIRVGDGTLGAPDRAPFDAIIIAAAGPIVPPSLLAQLAPGGRLVMPLGERHTQQVVRVTRSPDGQHLHTEALEPVVFVPLIGREGFAED